ncbi:MAG: choice-of-anchor Q domain-containing protein [Patescibacteria group bacterium]|nr:choice-of-anchor Q domain-containing protein [Patescibacteria group bacterium]
MENKFKSLIFVCVFILALSVHFLIFPRAEASGNLWYCDPVNGNTSTGDGSSEHPWGSIESVLAANKFESKYYNGSVRNSGAPIKAGDSVYLMDGYHGAISLSNYFNSDYISIQAAPGHNPKLSYIYLSSGSKWKFEGLSVSTEHSGSITKRSLIEIRGISYPASYITIENNDVFSKNDITGWTAQDWLDYGATTGIYTSSSNVSNITITNNRVKNIRMGIRVGASDSTIKYNTVTNIGGDSMTVLNNNNIIENNTFKNYFKPDPADHLDAIQFHRGADQVTPLANIIVRNNYILDFENNVTDTLKYSPQGITAFDAPPTNFTVENNVVITSHYHGITLERLSNSKVANNLVFDHLPNDSMNTAIRIHGGIAGVPATNSIVRNNIAADYALTLDASSAADHNINYRTEGGANSFFANYSQLDLHHIASSPAVNSGICANAPSTDYDGVIRPQGSACDAGAYEYVLSSAPEPDTTPPAPPSGVGVN